MVQVQSSWFPVIDRNPQKFVPNIYKAQPGDYQKATQKVVRGIAGDAAGGALILLPVIPAKAGTQSRRRRRSWLWVPACAGMTILRRQVSQHFEQRVHVARIVGRARSRSAARRRERR